jgi:hypothetical protein
MSMGVGVGWYFGVYGGVCGCGCIGVGHLRTRAVVGIQQEHTGGFTLQSTAGECTEGEVSNG